MGDASSTRSRLDLVEPMLASIRTRLARISPAPWEGARPARQSSEDARQARRGVGTPPLGNRSPATPTLRCRSIGEDDLDTVVRLLGRGFPARAPDYWRRGFARHAARPLPAALPRYGFLLEADGEAVGVLLTLHTDQRFRPGGGLRCNLSSFYVDPRFRPQAALLERMAIRSRDLTYVNVTPAPHTWPLAESNGFVRYGRGQILAMPGIARRFPGISIRAIAADDALAELDADERALVRDHIGYGCLGFVWTDGARHRPILLQPRPIGLAGLVPGVRIPCLHLVYCDSVADLPRVARPLGRLMLRRHGTPLLLVDAAGSIKGLPGRFFAERGVKFTRGPNPVAPGDLAYTEIVLFGP